MGLKEISESIAAVRSSMGHCGGSSCEAHLDILLAQVAAELRRVERQPLGSVHNGVRDLVGLLEKESA